MKALTSTAVVSYMVKRGHNEKDAKKMVNGKDASGETHIDYVKRVYGEDISIRFAADVLSCVDLNTYRN